MDTTEMKRRPTPASEPIMVRVLGREYPTYIDKHGVQRFVENTAIRLMFDINPRAKRLRREATMDRKDYSRLLEAGIKGDALSRGEFMAVDQEPQMLDLNLFSAMLAQFPKRVDIDSVCELWMMFGYSVSGFAEVFMDTASPSQRKRIGLYNPLWEK